MSVILVFLIAVYGVSEYRLRRTYEVRASALSIAADSASVARGAHVVAIRGCADCHGADLGGTVMMDEPPFGRFVSTNLTRGRGGVAETYMAEDWDRAVRHGVAPGGRALLLMPSHEYAVMSDEDVAAVAAYLQSLPPVDRTPRQDLPPSRVGPVGRALYLAGQVPLVPAELVDHTSQSADAPPVGPTARYGAYLATSCTGCHGPALAGGPMPGGGPVAANLTPDPSTGLGRWSAGDFRRALREGVRPDGGRLAPEMPVAMTAALTDVEVAALWAYLRTQPARSTEGA
jgi:mono/diheme cytochrome c family protein